MRNTFNIQWLSCTIIIMALLHFQSSYAQTVPMTKIKKEKTTPKKAPTTKTAKPISKPKPKPQPKDSDGDGVVDDNDKCPSLYGFTRYNGCPIPDSDGDDINDEEDKCKNEKGLARYGGCPIPDTDGDGVNDENDPLPQKFGIGDKVTYKHLNHFNVSRKLYTQNKELIDLIILTRSIETDNEVRSWIDMFPMMNNEQKLKLKEMLLSERQKLDAIEEKYERQKDSIRARYQK